MFDPADLGRTVNLALALYVAVQAARPRAVAWWRGRPLEVRLLLLGGLALVLATAWGTAEALSHGVPGGSRVLVFTPALAWLAAGVTILHHRLRKDTP